MRNWNPQNASFRRRPRKRRCPVANPQKDMLATKLQISIAHKRPRQKPRFAQNLKAVANAQNQPARLRKSRHRPHHRAKPRNRPRPQIIAVRKTARNQHRVAICQRRFLVPKIPRFMPPKREPRERSPDRCSTPEIAKRKTSCATQTKSGKRDVANPTPPKQFTAPSFLLAPTAVRQKVYFHFCQQSKRQRHCQPLETTARRQKPTCSPQSPDYSKTVGTLPPTSPALRRRRPPLPTQYTCPPAPSQSPSQPSCAKAFFTASPCGSKTAFFGVIVTFAIIFLPPNSSLNFRPRQTSFLTNHPPQKSKPHKKSAHLTSPSHNLHKRDLQRKSWRTNQKQE